MTPREDKPRGRGETVPERLPDTTPQVFPGQNYDFTLQAVFEMQKTVGGLTEAIKTLSEQSRENTREITKISRVIYAAAAVVTVLTGIGAFLLNKAADALIRILSAKP